MVKNYTALERTETQHFNKLARNYDRNYGYDESFTQYKIAKKAQIFIDLLKKYRLPKTSTLLEVGCGTGAYTEVVARGLPASKIVAIDISPEIIKVAKRVRGGSKNVKYQVASIYNTGIKKNSVDCIFGFYVLHHLDITEACKEFTKILKPGGLIFFCEPNILNPLVYLIKSNSYLKKKVGDSPYEWAINPMTVWKQLQNFEPKAMWTSEFILPVRFLPYEWLVKIDILTTLAKRIPLIKYLGGSVLLFARKKGN